MRPVFLLLAVACSSPGHSGAGGELLLCGGDEVVAVDLGHGGRKTWSWRAPGELKALFRSIDECKPVEGGSKVLVTASSGGGAALVERATGKVLFWARVVNAHSAELLPGGRLVAASSVGDGGNRLLLYDVAVPDRPLASDELVSAHGAVWDEGRKLLWALGLAELRAYRVEGDVLARAATHELPSKGGHDLSAVPGGRDLVVTTDSEVVLFDRGTGTFRPHPDLGAAAKVKGVSVRPRTGRVAYVQAETSWWAETVRFLHPPGSLRREGERLYKARWLR